MRRTLPALAAVAITAVAVPLSIAGGATPVAATGTVAGTAAAKPADYTVATYDFHVTVPNEALGGTGTQRCLIVGDLYRPSNANRHHRVPVILTTNGFGGSKNDQSGLARVAVRHGYGVLSYSGLGFGGSGCKISLDDPSYDGRAGRQLISFLGGKTGIATTLAGKPVKAVRWIRHDRIDHRGHHAAHDPRVGMVGGSYGGEIQFAIADRDPRLDAIVPIITWNDLTYSLAPNDTGFRHGVSDDLAAPGTAKIEWLSLFFALGIADGIQGVKVDPSRDVGCVNFLTKACTAYAELAANVVDTPDLYAFARHASVESYIHGIRIPTLLLQGQGDSLFNLQESVATYRSLRRQHTPVKLIWQSWGHSISDPQPGEFASGPGALRTYEGQRIFAWFSHYLKGRKVATGPRFAYYRDYVHYSGHGPDTSQYAHASHFPVGRVKTFFGSGTSRLVRSRSAVRSGSQPYANLAGPAPLSYSEVSALQGSTIPDQRTKPFDTPGSYAAWKAKPLSHHLDVAGIPRATLHITAPTAVGATALTELQLFAKIYDVAPDGSIDLVRRLVAPVRVKDIAKPVHVQLPGLVHRFRKGHRIELVVAATDSAYRNANVVQPAIATTSRGAPTTLRLPIVK